ncbi:5',5'''-P-1,P-4-tetraphosphate phosphorylase 2 [Xylona heveae TC161]|uniref:5',5'''-P-1,P-4-tetraphosphate phosphorylase 2 n=1 Tax=Xylona heveae (strain CBS 132557 / TC161) TaxID=1328760 RepID=A0A165IJK1_XYLHT|nr:5',5'''-P-1,P-4-tetraphosphate phosphorylase 2 [Xylona heveae TC161]KZF24984.1 5',5'''-P-1,P-4-tetraphosphate phosphorylase 2 [Xylona heveae TC161]
MSFGLSETLPSIVRNRFNAAKAAGSLIFSPTELTVIHTAGVPFQLRYCPALAKKPTPKDGQRETNRPSKKPDPFDNPPQDLLVADTPPELPNHILVLNKFPIIPQHFILATKAFKQQTDLLEEDDLAATLACLKAWEDDKDLADGRETRRRLFAFFNSGEFSGASQPHRHVQFLPVEEMAGETAEGDWSLLTDSIGGSIDQSKSGVKLPFAYFTTAISPSSTPRELHEKYLSLYSQAVSALQKSDKASDLAGTNHHNAKTSSITISYNLSMTASSMVLCPRTKDGDILGFREDDSQQPIGPVALNGTILGGTLMVKTPEEWDLLRKDETKLYQLLETIGVAP